MQEAIACFDLDSFLSCMSGTKAWDQFKGILEAQIELCILKKLRRRSNRPPWLSKNILRLIRKKRWLCEWYTREGSKDYESFIQYKKVQKEVSRSIKVAKRNFERNLARNRKANSKAFYSHIKKITANRVTVGPLKHGDEIVSDNAQMASVLNDFFCSVFTEETMANLPGVEQLYTGGELLVTVIFTCGVIKKKLMQLKKSAAPGPDRLWQKV